jgi:radical SAM protein with 4Fe4S-binding SPASM domain
VLFGWELLTKEEVELIKRGVREGRALGGPFHLLIHPTDLCNLDCFFCYTEELRRVAAEFDWDRLRAVLDEGVELGVKSVALSGGGEPFLYRRLRELLERIEGHGLVIDTVNTNGTPLTAEIAATLMRCRLGDIRVSLNETTPETYGTMNRCSPRLFDKAMAGIGHLVQAKREHSADSEIRVQLFLWRDNRHRLLEMIETALATGADLVFINSMDGLESDQRMTAEERAELEPLIREALHRWAPRLRFSLTHERLHEFALAEQRPLAPEAVDLPGLTGSPTRIEHCIIGWHSATVAADGGVYPCCHFSTDPTRSIGSLTENTLRAIWLGDRAQAYRGEMRHLMLTRADPSLLPRRACFIHSLCMKRSDCAFNYYLAAPEVYWELEAWAESGPREKWTRGQQRRVAAEKILRRGKRLLKSVGTGGS